MNVRLAQSSFIFFSIAYLLGEISPIQRARVATMEIDTALILIIRKNYADIIACFPSIISAETSSE